MNSSSLGLVFLLCCCAPAVPGRAQCGLDHVSVAPPAQSGGNFGYAIAIDGERMLVGGRSGNQGILHAFERGSGRWALAQTLPTPASSTSYAFGQRALALSGATALIGEAPDPLFGVSGSTAYVFEHDGAQWTQVAALQPPSPVALSYFGNSVDVDGDRALVGAPGDGSGKVFAYRRSGGTWQYEQTLTAASGAVGDMFGYALALSGNRALITAPGQDQPFSGAGGAHVFEHDGAQWIYTATIFPSPAFSFANFGRVCALDGDRALISDFKSRAYFYDAVGSSWSKNVHFTAPTQGAYGTAVAVRGNVALVGSPDVPEHSPAPFGSVVVYDRVGPSWKMRDALTWCETTGAKASGTAVALSADSAAYASPHAANPQLPYGQVAVHTSAPGAPPLSCALSACRHTLSTGAGGTQRYWLNAGPPHGGKLALLLASLTGAEPGIVIDGLVVPLNPDALFTFTLSNPNTAPFAQTFGLLPAGGTLDPQLSLAPGFASALAGSFVSAAFVVIDPLGPQVVATSNAHRTRLTQ